MLWGIELYFYLASFRNYPQIARTQDNHYGNQFKREIPSLKMLSAGNGAIISNENILRSVISQTGFA